MLAPILHVNLQQQFKQFRLNYLNNLNNSCHRKKQSSSWSDDKKADRINLLQGLITGDLEVWQYMRQDYLLL